MVHCDTCGKDFSRKDALTRHKKYSCDASHKTEAKRNVDCVAKPYSKPVTILPEREERIPTFDGAEFSGEKPKSEETLIKIVEMLNIPQENPANILKEENVQKVPSKGPPAKKMKVIPLLSKSDQQMSEQSSDKDEENFVKAPYIGVEEKQLDEGTFKRGVRMEPPAKKMKIIPLLSKSDQPMPNQLSNMVRERSPPIVKAPHLNAEEKKLANKFTRLFREMKQTGKDNRGKLFVLLDGLRDSGLIDEADYDKAYDAIICK